MTKLSTYIPARPKSVTKTTTRTRTYEGGAGFSMDTKTELFLLAATNLVGGDTFYEKGEDRDDRFVNLIHAATQEDADWVRRFVPYLRDTMNMRSASIVMAVEYVIAGGQGGREVIASAIRRLDEPGEVLGYYRSRVGRGIPQPIKRGISDAMQSIASSRNVIRYQNRGGYSIKDVLRVTHAKPRDTTQAGLYKWAVSDGEDGGTDMTYAYGVLMGLPVEERRLLVVNEPQALQDAGMTWESVAGWLQGPMDAPVWEALIPHMGYMALLRNLRNFEQAGISDVAKAKVIERLSSEEEVARSRQFPFRFWSAYKNSSDFGYAAALEQAMEYSTQNVPELAGKTLVLIDDSGSMQWTYSQRSSMIMAQQASLFGVTIAKRNEGRVSLFPFSDHVKPEIKVNRRPVLRVMEGITNTGGGTYIHEAIRKTYKGHDRVIILTDMQAHDSDRGLVPAGVPVYTFDLVGYGKADRAYGKDNRYLLSGGLTDAAFRMIPLLEAGKNQDWPF